MKKILLWLITLGGAAILFWVCFLFIESRDTVHWSQTKGHVISSLLTIDHLPKFIDLSDDPMRWYGVDVQYEYSAGDREYFSNRVSFQDGGVRSPKSALKVMNKYRHQHEVTVYYDPANPRQAVLEPRNIGDILMPLVIGGFLVFLGLFFLYDQFWEVKVSQIDDYLYLGELYQKQGKLDQALAEFNRIVEDKPDVAQGYGSRGNLYFQQGKWDQAIADFNQAISIDPTDASIYFSRAKAYLGNKQFDEAWADIQMAQDMGFKVNPEILEEIKKGR